MADITIESATLADGTLTVIGSGFTRTTTVVEIDGNEMPFDTDGNKLTVADVPEGATEVDITKGGTTESASITTDVNPTQAGAASGTGSRAATPKGHTANTSTTAEGEDELSDATPAEIQSGAANAQTDQNPKTVVPKYKPKEHLEGPNFRESVHQQKLDRIEEDWGIGPRDPYPQGNPRPQREIYYEIHGFYPDDTERTEVAQKAGIK